MRKVVFYEVYLTGDQLICRKLFSASSLYFYCPLTCFIKAALLRDFLRRLAVITQLLSYHSHSLSLHILIG